MKKRILSFLLALLMFFGMLPLNVIAEGSEDYSSNVTGTAVFNPEWNTVSDEETVYGVAYVTNDPTLGLNMSTDYTMSLEGVMDQTFYINDYYSDGTGYWYELAALSGETLPGKLSAMPWVYQNDIPSGAYPDYLIVTPPVVEPTDPTDPVEPTDPTEPEDSCDCCENCTGAEGCQCLCGACDFCQPEEEELPVLTHPTGVEVTAESFPEGVTLTVQDVSVSSQLKKYEIPESKLVFGLDISLVNADSSEYQPDGALVKVPVSAPAGTSIGIIHDHDGDISFMGVTEVLSDGTVEFYTDSFSTFAGFTVDFHYNGVDFSIEGLTSILLSDLFTAMGIEEDAYAAESVVFSDNTLVGVERQDDGNWLLTSLEAFQTEETLIITFNDNRTIVIDVTDPAWEPVYFSFPNSATTGITGHTKDNVVGSKTVTVILYDAVTGKELDRATNTKVNGNFYLELRSDNSKYWFEITEVGGGHVQFREKGLLNNYNAYTYTSKLDQYSVTFERTKTGSGTVTIKVNCYPTLITNSTNSEYCYVRRVTKMAATNDTQTRSLNIVVDRVGNNDTTVTYSNLLFPDRNGDGNGHGDVEADRDIAITDTAPGYKNATKTESGTTYIVTVNPITYTIVFNGNGNTSGSMSNQVFEYDVAQNLQTNGYSRAYQVSFDSNGGDAVAARTATATFNGWATSSTGSVQYTNQQSVQKLTTTDGKQVNLYANWTLGSVTLPNPKKTGYAFKGWYTDAACSDGNEVKGTTYTPTSNVTLYAKWEANGNTLTFDFNDGTGNKRDCPVIYGSSNYYEVAWLNPARSGYAFDGWYTVDGTQVYGRDGYCLTGAYWNSSNQWIGTSDLTVYAHWIPIYQVTLDNQTATTAGTSSYWYVHNKVYDGVYYYTDAACTAALANYTITKPTKTGHIFGGYYTEANGGGTQYVDANGMCVGNRYQVAGNVTLYAKWTPITYTVTYDGNPSHDGVTADSTHTYDVAKTLTSNGYQRSGYKFVGWNTKADGTGTSYADQASVKNLTATNGATVTLYAQWKPIYKITLDSQKQTEETDNFYFVYTLDAYYSDETCDTALAGNKIVLPTKAGYTFAGFYTQEGGNGTQYIDENGNISSACCQLSANTTLYAKWNINTYTITYRYKDGETPESKQSYDYETSIILKVPERTGYNFLGWTNTTYDAQKENNNWLWVNYDYVNGQMQNPGNNHFGDVVLEARWEPITYTIRFNGGEGGVLPTGAKMDDITATYDGEEIQLTPNAFQRIIKVTYDVNGGKNLDPDDAVVSLEAKFANWLYGSKTYADQATVKNLASTQDAVVQMTVQWNLKSTTMPTAERDGYTFEGWMEEGVATGSNISAGSSYTPTRDTTLVAQWKAVDYTITYDSNGGSNVAPTAYNAEQAVTLAEAPTREGYKFDGWILQTAGGNWTAGDYTAGQVIGTGKYGNITLVAQWKEQCRYVLKFDANGGENAPAQIIQDWTDNTEHTFTWTQVPTRAGYTFLGWAEAATSEINVAGSSYNTYTVSGKETETVEKALFAIWKRDTGTLFMDYSGDGTPVIVTVTCTQAAEASELITIQTVINDDTTIVNLPTGEYSVTVESGTASYAASVKTNPNPQIVKNETAVVEISIGSKGLNWFTAFYWVKNQFGKQS